MDKLTEEIQDKIITYLLENCSSDTRDDINTEQLTSIIRLAILAHLTAEIEKIQFKATCLREEPYEAGFYDALDQVKEAFDK